MYKIFDFVCTTTECHEKDDVKELMVAEDEQPECECCGLNMLKYVPGPKGYVKWSL